MRYTAKPDTGSQRRNGLPWETSAGFFISFDKGLKKYILWLIEISYTEQDMKMKKLIGFIIYEIFGVPLAILLGIVILFTIFLVVNGEFFQTKWRMDMPDDGTMLCSMVGEGFRIHNDAWAYRVDRYQAFDAECRKRVK